MVVAATALAILLGSLYTSAQRPVYTAAASAYASVASGSTVSDLTQGGTYVEDTVKSYAGVATSAYVLDGVIRELHLKTTSTRLAEQVSAQAPLDTVLLNITATASTPAGAAAIANSVTSNLATAVQRLTPQKRGTVPAVLLTRIQPATAPTGPSSPNLVLDLGIAALLGLLIGIGLAVLRQRLDTRVRDAADARAVVAVPVLGEILHDATARSRPLLIGAADDSPRKEAFRTLRTNLDFLGYDRRSNSIVLTSSVEQEGKSVTAANLAVVLAEAGRKVVLVDADLRRPQVGTYFGLEDRVGLTDVLIGAVTLDQALQRVGVAGPIVLPAGRIPPNPSELLQSESMRTLITELEGTFDVVLIDTPPLVPVSDAAILTRRTSGALLLAASGLTNKADLRKAAASLQQVDGRILGLVLTKVPATRSTSYGYRRTDEPSVAKLPVQQGPTRGKTTTRVRT